MVEQKELSASQEGDIRQKGGGKGIVYSHCPVGLIAQASGLVTLSESHLYLLISVWPWEVHFPSLNLSFLNCKIGLIIVAIP